MSYKDFNSGSGIPSGLLNGLCWNRLARLGSWEFGLIKFKLAERIVASITLVVVKVLNRSEI